MQRLERFWTGLEHDALAFIYWCLLFTLFRLAFIFAFISQLNGDFSHILPALLLGARLSMKTAACIALGGGLLATIPSILIKWNLAKVRYIWHVLATLLFSVLFMARIPYYKNFNAAFDAHLFTGAHDDFGAIFMTALEEFGLVPRAIGAIIIGAILAYILYKLLVKTKVYALSELKRPYLTLAATFVLLPVVAVFIRYGGAFSFAAGINYTNAARLPSNLLNEAVLDDAQTIYRVWEIGEDLERAQNVDFSDSMLREKIAAAGGKQDADNLEAAFTHTIAAPKLASKPHNVVLVLGESLGAWAVLPEFKDLGLADNLIALENSAHGAHIATMLAHGGGTVQAVNGLVSGTPDVGLFENYRGISDERKYATGIGYIMKKLGYKTVFWYGGFSGWENIGNFTRSQSFDEFYSTDNLSANASEVNAWGMADDVLFKNINRYIESESPDEMVFHVILTTSNHPPFSIAVDSKGFDREAVRAKLPPDIDSSDETLTELGHYWYADKTIGDFVHEVEKSRDDTLFIITGDHSERFSFKREESKRILSTIPCIFYGKYVTPDLFKADAVGTEIQLAGTLAEMLGEPGFSYMALVPSMFTSDFAFNHNLFARGKELGAINTLAENEQSYIEALRQIGAYYILRGGK